MSIGMLARPDDSTHEIEVCQSVFSESGAHGDEKAVGHSRLLTRDGKPVTQRASWFSNSPDDSRQGTSHANCKLWIPGNRHGTELPRDSRTLLRDGRAVALGWLVGRQVEGQLVHRDLTVSETGCRCLRGRLPGWGHRWPPPGSEEFRP